MARRLTRGVVRDRPDIDPGQEFPMTPDTVVFDQLVLTAHAPKDLPDDDAERARRALSRRRFRRRVLAAARRACDRDPALAPVTLTLTR